MEKTITILAEDPRPDPQDDAALAAVREILLARNNTTDHRFGAASSVERLALRMEELREGFAPSRIQIVGHGAQGMLSLGYHWVNRYKEEPKGPYYVLDSNPYVHGVLADIATPNTEVLVLGCNVGDGSEGPHPTVARGPTLLFDLAQMWGCMVGAPTDLISAADFDVEGIFATRAILQRVKGFEFWGADAAPVPVVGGDDDPNITLTILRLAPVLGPRVHLFTDVPVSASLSADMLSAFRKEVQLDGLLALPELIFTGKQGLTPVRAEILGNGRLLRVTGPDGTRHYRAKTSMLPLVRRVTRVLIAPAFTPPSIP